MSVKNGLSQHVTATSSADGRAVRVILTGFGGTLLGTVLGLIAGANIGGNWFTSFSFAGQRGYEATGLIGAVVGGIALGAVGVWLGLRSRRAR